MNAPCRCVLRLGSPLCLVGFAPAKSLEISDFPRRSKALSRQVTFCFKFMRKRQKGRLGEDGPEARLLTTAQPSYAACSLNGKTPCCGAALGTQRLAV